MEVLPLAVNQPAVVQCTTISLGLERLMSPCGGNASMQSFYQLVYSHLSLGLQSLMSLCREETSTWSFYQLVYGHLCLGLQSLMSNV
jgi:hypothetical protein